MLIGIDTSYTLCGLTTKQEYVQLQNDPKIIYLTSFFSSFNRNLGYGKQRRVFSGNLPGTFDC